MRRLLSFDEKHLVTHDTSSEFKWGVHFFCKSQYGQWYYINFFFMLYHWNQCEWTVQTSSIIFILLFVEENLNWSRFVIRVWHWKRNSFKAITFLFYTCGSCCRFFVFFFDASERIAFDLTDASSYICIRLNSRESETPTKLNKWKLPVWASDVLSWPSVLVRVPIGTFVV